MFLLSSSHILSVSDFLVLPSSVPTPPFLNVTRENGTLIPAPPLLGHSQVSRSETPTEERRQRAPTAGQNEPAIRQALARWNNDSHLSESRRWRLINTLLTCPELHLAYNNIDHSPPRGCFFLLDEITTTLFPLFSPWSSHGRLAGRGKKWSALGRTGQVRRCHQERKESVPHALRRRDQSLAPCGGSRALASWGREVQAGSWGTWSCCPPSPPLSSGRLLKISHWFSTVSCDYRCDHEVSKQGWFYEHWNPPQRLSPHYLRFSRYHLPLVNI